MHLMNNMHENTNSVDSDKENDIPNLTNSEPSSGEEEMPEDIDYSTMPELTKDYSNVHRFYDSEEDSSESCSELEKDNGIYLITSVANLRRREVQGFETSFNERKTQLKKRQKVNRQKESKLKNASLAETQNLIKEKTSKDDKGIKHRNPRKSIFSEEKWGNNGRWKEIIEEGEKTVLNTTEEVRLIHIPNSKNQCLTESKPPPGRRKKEFLILKLVEKYSMNY